VTYVAQLNLITVAGWFVDLFSGAWTPMSHRPPRLVSTASEPAPDLMLSPPAVSLNLRRGKTPLLSIIKRSKTLLFLQHTDFSLLFFYLVLEFFLDLLRPPGGLSC
jgi:hypothetical protein